MTSAPDNESAAVTLALCQLSYAAEAAAGLEPAPPS